MSCNVRFIPIALVILWSGVVLGQEIGIGEASGTIAPPPSVVRGTVTDAKGPVGGATILVEVTDMGSRRQIFNTRARTDQNGRYEADLSSVKSDWIGIQVDVLSRHHKQAMQIEIIERSSLPIEIPFEIQPGMSVSGRVLTDAGKPVPGATVEIPYIRPATSEFDGFFTILGAPLVSQFSIAAMAEGYSPQNLLIETQLDGTAPEIEFRLKPERTVKGRVVDEQGSPIPDAEVTIYLPLQRTWRKSDEKGEFIVKDLPYEASCGIIVVSHRDYAPYEKGTEVREGNTTLTIELIRGGQLEGTVRDPDGKAIPGANVMLSVPNRPPGYAARTDLKGHFELEHLMPQEVIVTILPPGSDTLKRSGELLLRHRGNRITGNIDPWPDETASDFVGIFDKQNLSIDRTDRPSGEKGEEGRPAIASYRGTLSSDGLTLEGTFRLNSGTQEGSWKASRKQGKPDDLSGLWRWEETLNPPKVMLGPERKTVEVKGGQTESLEFTLAPGWTLEGIVKDSTGNPVANAEITVAEWKDNPFVPGSTKSKEDGTFRIEGLPKDGKIVVHTIHPESGNARLPFDTPPTAGERVEIALEWQPIASSSQQLQDMESMFNKTVKSGEMALDFTATATNGTSIHLQDLRGKVVLLDFWASWCGPCIAELPELIRMYKKLKNREDFVLIGVSLDFEEEDFKKAVEEYEIEWMQLFDGKGWDTDLATSYGLMAIPYNFLIDRDGKVVATDLRGEEVHKAVREVLDQKK